MTAEELFGVAVRTVGLVVVLYGHWYLGFGLVEAGQSKEPEDAEKKVRSKTLIIMGSLIIAAGCLVATQANWFVERLY